MTTIELMKNEETKDRRVLNVSIALKDRFEGVVKVHKQKQKTVVERLVEWFVMQDMPTQSFIINGVSHIHAKARRPVIEAIAESIIQQGEAWDDRLKGMGTDAAAGAIEKIADQQQDEAASRVPGRRRAQGA
jgi:hypothetical protein